MISIECGVVNDLKTDLAAYLAERLPAVPLVHANDIVLDPYDGDMIMIEDVRIHVRTFLSDKDILGNCLVFIDGDKVQIKTIMPRKVEVEEKDIGLIACPHCGLVTAFQEEMDLHMRTHFFV